MKKLFQRDLLPIENTISSLTCSRDGIKIEGTVNEDRSDLMLLIFFCKKTSPSISGKRVSPDDDSKLSESIRTCS